MPKKQEKSSKVSTATMPTKKQRSFPEEPEWAATATSPIATEEKSHRKKQGGRPRERGGGGEGIAPNRHHHHEPNLVVHRHYDSAHSREQETADVGVSTQLFRALLIPFSYSYLIAET